MTMSIRDRLKKVFHDSFLSLFTEEERELPIDLEASIQQARLELDGATDALAAYMVTHLQLVEEQEKAHIKFDALNEKLDRLLAENRDEEARVLVKERIKMKKDFIHLDERLANSARYKGQLNKHMEEMKEKLLEMQQRQLDIALRTRAAESIERIANAQIKLRQHHIDVTSDAIEYKTLLKETANQLAEQEMETLDARLDSLLDEDEIEQELAHLKAERSCDA
jgi:phage shock protein A